MGTTQKEILGMRLEKEGPKLLRSTVSLQRTGPRAVPFRVVRGTVSEISLSGTHSGSRKQQVASVTHRGNAAVPELPEARGLGVEIRSTVSLQRARIEVRCRTGNLGTLYPFVTHTGNAAVS